MPQYTQTRTHTQHHTETRNGAIELTKERGVYNLYVQVAGGDGSIEQAVDVSPNEMEVDESGHRASSAGEPVRPREMGVPSDGGDEAVAPRVPPVPVKPTQAEQDEHCATGHAAYQNLPTHGNHVLQRFNEETFGSFPFSSVRIDREQHVPDSSNHSLSLIKLFSFSCPEGNKRLVLFSKHNERCERQYRHEPPPAFVHHLSSPDTLCLTQTTFKITEHIHILVHIKIHIHLRIRSHISILKNICIYIYMCHHESIVKDTTTFDMELCGCKQATAHAHLRPHGVCD